MSTKNPMPNLMMQPAMLAEMSQQWFNAYKTALDTLLAISNAALAGAEHMRMAQLATDIETQAQNRDALAAVAGARDMEGLMKAQQALSQAYLDGFMKYWATTAEMVQQTQAEIGKVMSAHMGGMKGFESMMPMMKPGEMPQLQAPFNAAIEAMRQSQEAMMKAMSGFAGAAPGRSKGRD